MTGVEPAIPAFVVRCLIHWATRPYLCKIWDMYFKVYYYVLYVIWWNNQIFPLLSLVLSYIFWLNIVWLKNTYSSSYGEIGILFGCTYVLDVLWGQPIKLIQVASNSEMHVNQWNDLLFFEIVPCHFCWASEVQT